MAEDPVGKSEAPGAQQDRPDDDQRHIGEDREAEGERHVIADAELAADLDLAQRPGDEGAEGADRDDLPDAAFPQRREAEPVFEVGRRDVDLPDVPGRSERRALEDHRGAERGEDDRRDAEEADVERSDPEVEQVAA